MLQMSVKSLLLKWRQNAIQQWIIRGSFATAGIFCSKNTKPLTELKILRWNHPRKALAKTFPPPLWSVFNLVSLPCGEGEEKDWINPLVYWRTKNIFQFHFTLPRPALICPPVGSEVLGPPRRPCCWDPPDPPSPLPLAADGCIGGCAPSNHRLLPPHLPSVDSRHGRSLRLFWERPLKGVGEKPTPYFTIRTCRGNNHLHWQDAKELFFSFFYLFEADGSSGTAVLLPRHTLQWWSCHWGKASARLTFFLSTIHHCHLYPREAYSDHTPN